MEGYYNFKKMNEGVKNLLRKKRVKVLMKKV